MPEGLPAPFEPAPSDLSERQRQVWQHLSRDPVLGGLLEQHGLPEVVAAEDPLSALIRSVVGQQLSVRAARAIAQRLQEATAYDPAALVAMRPEDLRALGLSWAKVKTVQAAAQAQLTGEIDFAALPLLESEEVIARLVQLPGIGRWTAEMFLMSALGREDVFSFGDLGLRRALERHYALTQAQGEILPKGPHPLHQAQVASWQPYRTYAARLLWRSLDNTPGESGSGRPATPAQPARQGLSSKKAAQEDNIK